MRTVILTLVGAVALGGCEGTMVGHGLMGRGTVGHGAGDHGSVGNGTVDHGTSGHAMAGHDEMAAACPMAVEGTSVRAEDVAGGVAVVFSTSGDVAELRSRVGRMAEMHERHGGGSGPESPGGATHGGHMMHGMHGGHGATTGHEMAPAAEARAEDVDGGARLVLVPRDPAQLGALREHVRRHVDAMASGRCPMMSMRGTGR